jgi:hypothetical protein
MCNRPIPINQQQVSLPAPNYLMPAGYDCLAECAGFVLMFAYLYPHIPLSVNKNSAPTEVIPLMRCVYNAYVRCARSLFARGITYRL